MLANSLPEPLLLELCVHTGSRVELVKVVRLRMARRVFMNRGRVQEL
jgi:hypothetical protein